MKTLGKFVLISSDTKKQMLLDWKNTYMNKTSQKSIDPMMYSEKKKIISELQPLQKLNRLSHNQSQKKILKTNVKTSASTHKITPYVYANPERQNGIISSFNNIQPHRTLYRSRSLGKNFNKIGQNLLPKNSINEGQISQKIKELSKLKGGKIICVMTMRRSGLRFKVSHNFYIYEPSLKHQCFLQEIKEKQFRELSHKNVYLFHLSKEPINKIGRDLNERQYIIFADISPKFNLGFEFQMKLFEQASIIQDLIKKYLYQYALSQFEQKNKDYESQQQFQGVRPISQFVERIKRDRQAKKILKKQQQFEWQKIKNVNDYVDKMIDNPAYGQTIQRDQTQPNEIDQWTSQQFSNKYVKNKNSQQKNAFFDIQTHFPRETIDTIGLEATLQKLQEISTTQNIHQIKHRAVENMMEKIKRQGQNAQKLKRQEENKIKTIGYKSGKQFFKELDKKNTLLVDQNIPYIMAKYGITRGEAYNLYNIYKALEKISAMKYFDSNQFRRVKQKGIDRATFDQGLKNLQINPGQEVIRNICYFPEFIKWEQFIKIISISLQKTTESKLQAILEGIGSSSNGQLTEKQISVMVGSSLQKIFGRQQPDLRSHFTNLVMKTLDVDSSGTISCPQIKNHVLKRGIQDLDLISYLILNS